MKNKEQSNDMTAPFYTIIFLYNTYSIVNESSALEYK